MKGSKLYMIFLFAFLVLVFLAEYMTPHQFSWKATYDKNDKEPFGSYVFDDVLSSSIDQYTISNKTFYQLLQEDSTLSEHAFLLTENYISFNETDIESLYKLIYSGNQVMICTDAFPYTLEDILCFGISYEGYLPSFDYYIREKVKVRDSIFFGTDTLNPECIFEVYPQMHPVSLVAGKQIWNYDEIPRTPPRMKASQNDVNQDIRRADSSQTDTLQANTLRSETEVFFATADIIEADSMAENDITEDYISEDSLAVDSVIQEYGKYEFFPMRCDSFQVVVWDNKNQPLVIRAFIGKGEIILVSTPLMFTNYGILDGNNAAYAFRLLSLMKGKPLTRIEAYGRHSGEARTPLRYVLSDPPLRWAIYAILTLLILFMIFTAKRRQRVIPVVKTPPNRTFGFMELISNLYYQKHDNAEILKMKHTYFCAEVKSLIGVDLQENVPDESDFNRLAEKTGMEKDLLSTLLKNMQMALYRSQTDDLQLKQYIDGMNDVLRALKT